MEISKLPNIEGLLTPSFPLKPPATITTCPENSIGRDAQVVGDLNPLATSREPSASFMIDKQRKRYTRPRSLTVRP